MVSTIIIQYTEMEISKHLYKRMQFKRVNFVFHLIYIVIMRKYHLTCNPRIKEMHRKQDLQSLADSETEEYC